MIAHEFRFASGRMRVKELIDEGYIGQLHMALLKLVIGPRRTSGTTSEQWRRRLLGRRLPRRSGFPLHRLPAPLVRRQFTPRIAPHLSRLLLWIQTKTKDKRQDNLSEELSLGLRV